jgi:hypothetical protein
MKFLSFPEVIRHREAKRWHATSFLYDFQLDKAADEMIPLLAEYDPASYDYLVLKINLMAALLASVHLPKRKKLFERLAKEVKSGIQTHGAKRLQGSYESLLVQGAFFSESEGVLKLEESAVETELDFFKQFTALFHEARAGRVGGPFLERRFKALRQIAFEQKWFEAVREIDLHYCRIFRPEFLPFVKMGTRLPHYQARHLDKVHPDVHFCFSRTSAMSEMPKLQAAYVVRDLPEAPKLRELFSLFYSEQYATLTPYVIWLVIAKGEHFISPHSGNRVHQWVKRLKFWLKRKKIPAQIVSSKDGYRLVATSVLSCKASLLKTQNPETELLLSLKHQFANGKTFSIHELASLAPGLTLRELQYRLRNYIESKAVVKSGKARRVRYQLV